MPEPTDPIMSIVMEIICMAVLTLANLVTGTLTLTWARNSRKPATTNSLAKIKRQGISSALPALTSSTRTHPTST